VIVMNNHFAELTIDELDNVNGGEFPGDALGESLKLGAEGTVKALNQSDAPNITQGINSFNQNYNPIYKGLSAAQNYFNPQPGHGAPGDTYNPATQNANGSINPASFSAP
jgi:bacteriocin-like protein